MVQVQFLESGSRTLLFTSWPGQDPPVPRRGDFVVLPVTPAEALGGTWAAYENWRRWKVDETEWGYPPPPLTPYVYPPEPIVYVVQVCVSPVP